MITDPAEFTDVNVVKVVRDVDDFALYFSRAPIPAGNGENVNRGFRHIGIYAYRMKLLDRYVNWPRVDLEVTERLEQLRALAHGVNIHVATTRETFPPGIDTIHDLDTARRFVAKTTNV